MFTFRCIIHVVLVSLLCAAGVAARGARVAVEEFTLERTECFGPCPVYKVTISPDGMVTYVGKKNVRRVGTYTGHADPRAVRKLAELVEQIGYFRLEDEYTTEMTDLPSAISSVRRGGVRKTVKNYGMAGPSQLWALENSIDAVVATVTDWKRNRR